MTEISAKYLIGEQLELPSALNSDAEGNTPSPSALGNDAEQKFNRLIDFLTKRTRDGNGCLSITKASRSTGSQNQYFRYTYRENGKQRVKSIPGGNIRSPLAQQRATTIKQMIQKGRPTSEIIYAIGSFRNQRRR